MTESDSRKSPTWADRITAGSTLVLALITVGAVVCYWQNLRLLIKSQQLQVHPYLQVSPVLSEKVYSYVEIADPNKIWEYFVASLSNLSNVPAKKVKLVIPSASIDRYYPSSKLTSSYESIKTFVESDKEPNRIDLRFLSEIPAQQFDMGPHERVDHYMIYLPMTPNQKKVLYSNDPNGLLSNYAVLYILTVVKYESLMGDKYETRCLWRLTHLPQGSSHLTTVGFQPDKERASFSIMWGENVLLEGK